MLRPNAIILVGFLIFTPVVIADENPETTAFT